MEDAAIIQLYWQRNEDGIRETDRAYGPRLRTLARGIVSSQEDAQECVSDTYWQAWRTIPPQRPRYFYAYLAKICRFGAFGILDRRKAAKRSAQLVSLTREMEMCIPDSLQNVSVESRELAKAMNDFLNDLPRDSRLIFLRRYWYGDSVEQIAGRYGMTQSKIKTQLFRTRNKLRSYLEKEGIDL